MSGLRVAYVAALDLPDNPRAHAMQVMKNAQAWARAADDFEFITNVHHTHYFPLRRADLATYFGLSRPFPVTAYPLQGLDEAGALRTLYYRLAARRCARRKVDLVFTRANLLPPFALAHGLPTVVESHSPPGDEADKARLYRVLDHPRLMALVTISEPLAQRYRQAGLPADKILVQPDGVDLERFERPLDVAAAKARLGLDPGRPLAVYVGHLYEGRGIEEILTAAARLPEVAFLLVGGYPAHVEKWRRQAGEQGLGNLLFQGFVANQEVPAMLWAADVLLMPYSARCETAEWMSPLKMFEYMAAGRAMVATDLPALGTVLRHGHNAWLPPPDDGEALAAGVAHLLAHPELAAALARNARADVQPYGWDQRVANILRFVRQRQAGTGA